MTHQILTINASAHGEDGTSYALSHALSAELAKKYGNAVTINRDLSVSDLPLINKRWVNANFTPEEERNDDHKNALALSNSYIEELMHSDTVVIGTPIYNFSVPSTLRAYIDLICRARLTFKYTENGPVGLLENKKAFIVITSGGVPVDSTMDFATPYLKQVLNFIGINDITVIDATQRNADKDGTKLDAVKNTIAATAAAI